MQENETEKTLAAEEAKGPENAAPAEETKTPEEPQSADETAEGDAKASEAAEEGENTEKPPFSPKAMFNDVMEILETVLTSVFVILFIFSYLARPVTVEGSSMNPTLTNGDRLAMIRLCYTPKKGDIVVVNDDEGGMIFGADGTPVSSGYSLNECIIKRVIAVAGEEIDIDTTEGRVYIDGQLQDEPYINEATLTNDGAFSYPITIPEGYVFVMGDNLNHSTDSRSPAVGLVPVEKVLGTTYFRYSPGSQLGFVK